MKQSLNKLVDNLYTGKQKLTVKEIVRENKKKNVEDKHLLNYKILAVAIKDKIEDNAKESLSEFYQIDNLEDMDFLTEVDYVIADIIITLSKLTNKDINAGFEDALVLDKTQPEFEYLVNEVEKYLSK